MNDIELLVKAICEYLEELLKNTPDIDDCESIAELVEALASLIRSTL